MEVWTQRVQCKVNVTPYFARYPLRSHFHQPQKTEIHFLNELQHSRARAIKDGLP